MTYANTTKNSGKALLNVGNNSSDCKGVESNYYKQEFYFDTESTKYNKYKRKWMAY